MRRRVLVAVVVALALAGASCGGDDKSDAAGKVQAGNSTTTDARSTGDGSGGGGSATGTPAVFSSAECLGAVQAMASAASSAGFALGGKTDQIDATAKQFAEFAKKAPADIRNDINTLSDAYAEYGRIIAKSGWSPTSGKPLPQSVVDDLAKASKTLETTEIVDAQRRLAAWFQNECGR